ncbi:MAG: lysozyme inhibitor LprI family protein [Bradyrhizobium sp.]
MERAICGDDELADWDARMGQTYQQAIRTQRDPRALQDSQRNWIVQRDRACGSSPEITFSCLLDMTKQRTTALAQFVATASPPPAPAPTPTPATVPQVLNMSPASSEATARQAIPSATTTSPTPTSSDGDFPKVFLFVLFLGALYVVVKIANSARRKRLLIAKYGDAVAARIIARQIWQGMTDQQLIDSWGRPVEIGSEVMRTKTKEIWKYGQTGKNRFRERVTVENGIVSGWKN